VLLQDKFKPRDPSEPSLVDAFDGFAKRAREWKPFKHEAHKNQPNAQPHSYKPFLTLLDEPPSMKNFAIVWGLTAALTSLGFNTALYSPNLTGGFWVLNASLVTLFSLFLMGVTAGWAAYNAADEGPRVQRVHEGFWELYNNVVWGLDTRGLDTKGVDKKGADTKGADTEGADTKGADTKGADTKVKKPPPPARVRVVVQLKNSLEASRSLTT
jgi:hypothetical protein